MLTDSYHSYRELAVFSLACGESSKAVEYAKMSLRLSATAPEKTPHTSKRT
jgi:hypothetical protein